MVMFRRPDVYILRTPVSATRVIAHITMDANFSPMAWLIFPASGGDTTDRFGATMKTIKIAPPIQTATATMWIKMSRTVKILATIAISRLFFLCLWYL